MDSAHVLPLLTDTEIRVLGSLMEKCKVTPDYYPMTVNGLTAACNQKTARNPVVQYDEETIVQTLNSLKKKGLVSTATGGSNRVIKYKHNFAIVFPVIPAEVALICLLMLRGPQTPGELNTNSGRMHEFESLEEILSMLEKLAGDIPAFVKQLPRRPGQKEVRYVHLLGGNIDDIYIEDKIPQASSDLEQRVSALELELADLQANFNKLMKELNG